MPGFGSGHAGFNNRKVAWLPQHYLANRDNRFRQVRPIPANEQVRDRLIKLVMIGIGSVTRMTALRIKHAVDRGFRVIWTPFATLAYHSVGNSW